MSVRRYSRSPRSPFWPGSSTAPQRRPISRPDARGARDGSPCVTAVHPRGLSRSRLRWAPRRTRRSEPCSATPWTREGEPALRPLAVRAAGQASGLEPGRAPPSKAAPVRARGQAREQAQVRAVTPVGATEARCDAEATSADRRRCRRHPRGCRGARMERCARPRRRGRARRSRRLRRRSVPCGRGAVRDASVTPCGRRPSRS
jgi:hypothetical protein